jgi:DNA transposition AAA+ family ATPase
MSESREQIRQFIRDEVGLLMGKQFRDRAADIVHSKLKSTEPDLLTSDVKQVVDEEVERANERLR